MVRKMDLQPDGRSLIFDGNTIEEKRDLHTVSTNEAYVSGSQGFDHSKNRDVLESMHQQ